MVFRDALKSIYDKYDTLGVILRVSSVYNLIFYSHDYKKV